MKDPRVYLAQIFECIERELPPVKNAIADLLPPLDQLEAELAGEEPTMNP